MPRWPLVAALAALTLMAPASASANPAITVTSAMQPGSTSSFPLTARHVLTLTAGATAERLTVGVNPWSALTVMGATVVPVTSATGPSLTHVRRSLEPDAGARRVPLREPARGHGDVHDRGGPDGHRHRRHHAHAHAVQRRHARRRVGHRARAGRPVHGLLARARGLRRAARRGPRLRALPRRWRLPDRRHGGPGRRARPRRALGLPATQQEGGPARAGRRSARADGCCAAGGRTGAASGSCTRATRAAGAPTPTAPRSAERCCGSAERSARRRRRVTHDEAGRQDHARRLRPAGAATCARPSRPSRGAAARSWSAGGERRRRPACRRSR